MVFADGFWAIKTLVDWFTVVGGILALVSIWFSWWLAKRDLSKRITEARTKLVEAILQSDVTEALRAVREAREAVRVKRWERAIDRCEQATHRIPRFSHLPGLEAADREKLVLAVDKLLGLIRQIEEVVAAKKSALTAPKLKDLDELIITLATIEGKIRASGLR